MSKVLSGIMGLCVGDAVGVPAEFKSREAMNKKPVKDMIGYGTYNLPAGTWSDDSSLTLCLVDSLSNDLNYSDIMDKFVLWFKNAEYTPYGEVFDVGNTTRYSILNYLNGVFPLECGGKDEQNNGNGSLMRILPIAFYLDSLYNRKNIEQIMEIIHNLSSLTHGHSISKIACGIYTLIAIEVIAGYDLFESINKGIKNAFNYYENKDPYERYVCNYERLRNISEFSKLSSDSIKSSGYVVDTLEAMIWCLTNSKNFKECVLLAVNLGDDTDTVAAVAGGIAGIHYGYDNIPSEWIEKIAKKKYIEDLCAKLEKKLYGIKENQK